MKKTTSIRGKTQFLIFTYRCQGKAVEKKLPWKKDTINLDFAYEEFDAIVTDCNCGRDHIIDL